MRKGGGAVVSLLIRPWARAGRASRAYTGEAQGFQGDGVLRNASRAYTGEAQGFQGDGGAQMGEQNPKVALGSLS